MSLTTGTGGEDGVSMHQAAPKGLAFHKSAGGLIASRGLRKICLFNLSHPDEAVTSIGGEGTFAGVWSNLSELRHISFRF